MGRGHQHSTSRTNNINNNKNRTYSSQRNTIYKNDKSNQKTAKISQKKFYKDNKNIKKFLPRNQRNTFNKYMCILCNTVHPIKECRKFLAMSINRRENYIERQHYCQNCLARSHDGRACPSIDRCKICDGFHHTLLHPNRSPISTRQLRQRRRNLKPTTLPTNSTIPATHVISEAIKSLATILCSTN
ncbi:uncharacterized protein ACRADG_010900 isoform 1-T2 [Cochliomyia hominivorax]